MPKSPHSQCFCKISHAESHEFHEESNGLNSFPSPSLMKSNDFKGFHLLMIMADPLLGGSAKKSAFSNSAYLVDLQGGGVINPGLALYSIFQTISDLMIMIIICLSFHFCVTPCFPFRHSDLENAPLRGGAGLGVV